MDGTTRRSIAAGGGEGNHDLKSPFTGSAMRSRARTTKLQASARDLRVRRVALLLTLRTLLLSIRNRRPISLPNALRLHKRRLTGLAPSGKTGEREGLFWLTDFYRREQPFRNANWGRWYREAGLMLLAQHRSVPAGDEISSASGPSP